MYIRLLHFCVLGKSVTRITTVRRLLILSSPLPILDHHFYFFLILRNVEEKIK